MPILVDRRAEGYHPGYAGLHRFTRFGGLVYKETARSRSTSLRSPP